jgi:hypothetical protein
LDVQSTTTGLLLPRMCTAARNAIPSPAAGLLIYNNQTNEFNFYNGTEWCVITSTFVDASSGINSPGGGTAINTDGASPDNSARLDIMDASRGVLFPRTTPGSISSPATGLVIYNTSTNNFNFFKAVDGSSSILHQPG